jgi:phospholipid transport system transporter-binding protein
VIVREGDRYFIEGALTMATVQTALAEGRQLFDGPQVQVDLSRITEVDSSALSVLLEWVRVASGGGRTMRYMDCAANLKSLAVLYGVSDLLPGVND